MSTYMDRRAKLLTILLKEKYKEHPTFGTSINGLADELGLTYSQVNYAIGYARNRMSKDGDQITCFNRGNTWYYKMPSMRDSDDYIRDQRGRNITQQLCHMVLMARKNRARWGERAFIIAVQDHLVGAVQEMVRAGVPGADRMLEEALRPIEKEENGSPV